MILFHAKYFYVYNFNTLKEKLFDTKGKISK
jgi:hypothetical protein